jgi:hypothetical protein
MNKVRRTRGRNRNTIAIESQPPQYAVSLSCEIEFSMNSPWSKKTWNLNWPARRGSASSSLSVARKRWHVSATFACASFWISPKYA